MFKYLPRHAFVLVTAVYVTDLPPLFNWAHSILAAVIVPTVLQSCCLPLVRNCLYLLALALFIICVQMNIMSVQSYSTALIWVCPQCTLIFFYQAFMSILATWLAIWSSAEFGYSSPLRVRIPIVKKKTNKQKQKTKFKGKINISAQTFN